MGDDKKVELKREKYMRLPNKCVVDTNVPKTANLAINFASCPGFHSDVPLSCMDVCIEAIRYITQNKAKLVMDDGFELFDEYRRQLSLKGQPGIGDAFVKWIHDHQWKPSHVERVCITKNGETYDQFPEHEGLYDFDHADRKFVAVANAHAEKPPILQATDSKWWGWKDALEEVGIQVNFLCPEYVREKYEKKMGA